MTAGRSRLSSVVGALLLQSLLSLLLSVALARLLGPGGRGVYGTVTLVALIAGALGTIGFDTGHAFAVGRDRGRAPAGFASSLLVAGLAAVTLTPLVVWLGYTGCLGPIEFRLLVLGATAIPALVLAPLLQGVLAGLGRVPLGCWLSAVGVGLTLVFVGFAAYLRPADPGVAVMAFVGGQFGNTALLLVSLGHSVGWKLADPRPMLRQALAFSLTSHAANVLHLLHLRIDVFLVNYFLDPRQVGYYVLALGLCEWIWLLPRAAAALHLPAVASATSEAALGRTAGLVRLTLLFSVGGALALALVAPWLVPLVYGPAFAATSAPLLLLLPGVALGSVASVLSSHFTGSGRPQLPLANSLMSLTANVALNSLLIPSAGILGAAVAAAITYTLCSGINVLFLWRRDGLTPGDLLRFRPEEARAAVGRLLAWGRPR